MSVLFLLCIICSGVGGSKLDIKDPKAAVTKATGEVKVGKYIFVLTVKDVEGTSSVINHVINVKERKYKKIILVN